MVTPKALLKQSPFQLLTSGSVRLFAASLLTVLLLNSNSAYASDWRWLGVKRTVVIADIHGAYDQLLELLQANQLVDKSLNWIGKDTHLVSVGDLIDRGSGSRKVMDLLIELQQQAQLQKGQVHVIAGNHELMNLLGDYRYVSKEIFASFINDENADQRDTAWRDFLIKNTPAKIISDTDKRRATLTAGKEKSELRELFNNSYPPGYFAYRRAFSSEGYYGKWLLSLPAVIVINDTAFVHGGLTEITANHSLKDLNSKFQTSTKRYIDLKRQLISGGLLPDDEAIKSEQVSNANIMQNTDGPLWSRNQVFCRKTLERPALDAALNNLKAKRVVVGHTPTQDAKVHSIHDGRLIMLDTGMLQAVYNGRPSSLEIDSQDNLSVRYTRPLEFGKPIVEQRPNDYGLTDLQTLDLLTTGKATIVNRRVNKAWEIEITQGTKTLSAVFYRNRNKRANNEIAAYKLSQLIGLDIVPTTIARTISGIKGALQLRFKNTLSEFERNKDEINPGGFCSMSRQYHLMYLTDILFNHKGGTTDRVLYDTGNWLLYLTDFSHSFGVTKKLPKLKMKVNIAPGIRSNLNSLNYNQLTGILSNLMSRKQIKAFLSRRDKLLAKY